MITILVSWAACILAVEAIAEIVSSSEVFRPTRERLSRLPGKVGWYFGGLVSCGYCFSVWLSMAAAVAVPGHLLEGDEWWWVVSDLVVKTFVIHRLSNVLHTLIARWTGNKPILISLASLGRSPEVQVPTKAPDSPPRV